jgi:hypothetical protein
LSNRWKKYLLVEHLAVLGNEPQPLQSSRGQDSGIYHSLSLFPQASIHVAAQHRYMQTGVEM